MILVALLSLLVGTHAYQIYYVEQNCLSGNLIIPLDGDTENSSVLLHVSTFHTSYTLGMDCKIELSTTSAHKIVVAIRELGFRINYDGTCKDYLKIKQAKCEKLFRLDEEHHYFSSGNSLSMLYHIDKDGMDNKTQSGYVGFKLTVTAVAQEEEECSGEERFRCTNRLCIWSGLRCDTHNNCGDLSDEQDCSSGGGASTALIILGVVILLLLILMCSATLLCTKNATVRRFSHRLRSRTFSYLPARFSR